MKTLKENEDYTIHQEGDRFWVNGKHNCLGRFTPNGWEIYRDMNAPTEVIGTTATLIVRKQANKPIDWENFKKMLKENHKIDLGDREYPSEQQ